MVTRMVTHGPSTMHVARCLPCLACRERPGGKAGVQGLAWVLARPGVLAVVLAPATLLLWDTKSACTRSHRLAATPTPAGAGRPLTPAPERQRTCTQAWHQRRIP
jgi:hypothetical protein